MRHDLLSDIVKMSGAHCTVTRAMEVHGDWHFRFTTSDTLKYIFIAVMHGACWMSTEHEPTTLRIEPGSVVMLATGGRFALASDLSVPPREGTGVFRATTLSAPVAGASWNFQAICGHVALDATRGRLLAGALPATLHIGPDVPQAPKMRWLLDELVSELNEQRPGSNLAAEELSQLLLLQVIRAHVATPDSHVPGWIRAMADGRIASAVRLMHQEPAKPWRVESLAASVKMSRTSFAVRFSSAMGIAPLAYLTHWRMHLAEQALRSGVAPVSQVADSLGYRSNSAFSAAFGRAFGVSPTTYRITRRKSD